ncbi:acyl-CoA thioesterase [Streptomyces sp. NPDC057743]|uniref:acyl-CoA thioesterase n=1 Tax=Streptomyces sp. NPDC057743 TaxID=3346236 RepID=UPI0036D0A5F5
MTEVASVTTEAGTDGPFTVPITVRGYETDTQGHLNQSVYLQYAEHARWAALLAAGAPQSALVARGIGPVTLETTIRYRRELRAGDEVEVSCAFIWRDGKTSGKASGKTFVIEQTVRKADGSLSAEISAVCGLLDLTERHLVTDPRATLRELATHPEVLGLGEE